MRGRTSAPEEKIQIVLESMNTNITLAELCSNHHKLDPKAFWAPST
jgi:hypothetical protein